MFIDESGFLLQPLCKRTWAPRGKTPVHRVSARHDRRVSVIAAIGLSPDQRQASLNFQLTYESFKKDKIIHFLKNLHDELGGHVIVIWDRLNAHRSATRYFQETHPDWFTFEFLPPYAPELNPVEACWSHTKNHEMPNYYPEDVVELRGKVAHYLRRKRKRHDLLMSFFDHADLVL